MGLDEYNEYNGYKGYNGYVELAPVLTCGTIKAVSDTGVTVHIDGRLGAISVPLRWVFTDSPPAIGQKVEFYFSYMKAI
ncbi:MAG: hypothetical protein LBH39_04025 [Clostridiales Family XIII bacterium]|jgi:hypothetical protein|nr:hypothetical protein [Clostridiales Family XIII bacterium]